MTFRIWAAGFAILVAGVHVASWSQTPAPGQAPSPTGLILGRVVDADSNAPLSGVVVGLISEALIAAAVAQTQSGPPPRALTDAQGQFVFRKLPKGQYSITATVGGNGYSPSGFLVSGMGPQIGAYLNGGYGQLRPGGPTQTIDLAEGQRIGDAVVRLWKGGALNGTIYDEAGEPLVGTVVSAVRRSSDGRLLTGPTTMTDDRGMYHLGTLVPGEYVVVVPQTQILMPSSTIDAALSAPPDPMRSARFQNAGAPSPTATGVSVGSSVAAFAPDNNARVINTLPPSSQADRRFAYQTTFFSQAILASRATPLQIGSGQERSGIDVRLFPARTAEVSGTLLDASGPVPDFGVHLMPADAGDGSSVLEVARTATDGRGRFSFPLVPSGQYTLLAVRQAAPPTPPAARGAPPPPPFVPTTISEGRGAFATQAINVGDNNVGNLTLTLRAGVSVAGRVEFQGASAPLTPDRLRQVPVMAVRQSPLFRDSSPSTGYIDATGQFTIGGLPPGRYVIGPVERGPGFFGAWSLQTIRVAGREIGDASLAIESDLTDVVIVFTDRPAEVSGSVQGTTGAPDANATVFLFPKDAGRWRDARESTRSFRTVRASKTGAFTIPSVPPGDYLVVAASDAAAGDWPDEKVIRSFAGAATTVRVEAAGKSVVPLKTVVIR